MENPNIIQHNIRTVYIYELMKQIRKHSLPFINAVKENSDNVWGKDIRTILARATQDYKLKQEEINVELSSLYYTTKIPKNIIDYQSLCENIGEGVAKYLEEAFVKGDLWGTKSPFFGIGYALDKSKPYYNLNKDDEFYKANELHITEKDLYSAKGVYDIMRNAMKCAQTLDADNEYPSHIIMHPCMIPIFERYLNEDSNIFYCDTHGNFYIDFKSENVPLLAVNFSYEMPKTQMWLLNPESFRLHMLCNWVWLEDEFGMIFKTEDKFNYYATLVKYCNLICYNPKWNTKIIIGKK